MGIIDWNDLLKQVNKVIIPPRLIKEIEFITPGQPTISLDINLLDDESLHLLNHILVSDTNNKQIRVYIDLDKLESEVNNQCELIFSKIK